MSVLSPLVPALLTFLFTAATVYALAERWARPRRSLRARLAQLHTAPATPEESAPPAQAAGDVWLSGSAPGRALARALLAAGWRLRPAEFAGLSLLGVAGLALAGLVLTHHTTGILLLGLIGLLLPPVALARGREDRRRRFAAQVPDALTLLASGLRAGYAVGRAMQAVADEMPPPMADEFAWTLAETRLGLPLDEALARLVARTGSYDLDLVVTAIVTQRQVGGNMAEVLDSIGGTIRERVKIQGEVASLTAEGRLSAWVLFLLPPLVAVLLLLRDPHYFQPLLQSQIGRLMLGGASVAQVIGGLVLRRMVRLDV